VNKQKAKVQFAECDARLLLCIVYLFIVFSMSHITM